MGVVIRRRLLLAFGGGVDELLVVFYSVVLLEVERELLAAVLVCECECACVVFSKEGGEGSSAERARPSQLDRLSCMHPPAIASTTP